MISSAHLSLFGSNATPDSRRSPHDLRFVITSRRFHYGDRFDPSKRAGIGQTGTGPKLAETLSALGHCRRCASDFDVGLVVLVAGHNGNGRVLQLSPSADGRAPDWLCARAPLRRRISRGSRARYTLLTCRRTAFRGRILPLRNQPLVPDGACLLADRRGSFLGDDAILVARPDQLERAQQHPLAHNSRYRGSLRSDDSRLRLYPTLISRVEAASCHSRRRNRRFHSHSPCAESIARRLSKREI